MGRGERPRVRMQGCAHRASPTQPPRSHPPPPLPPLAPSSEAKRLGGQQGRWWQQGHGRELAGKACRGSSRAVGRTWEGAGRATGGGLTEMLRKEEGGA